MGFIRFFAKSRLLTAEIVGDVAVAAAEEMGIQNAHLLSAIRGVGVGAGAYAPMLPLLSVAMLPIPGIKTVCAATALALDVASLPAMAEQAVADLRAPAPAPAVN